MSDNYNEPILAEDFITDFLLKLSNEVYKARCETPEYVAFLKQRRAWNETLERLDGRFLKEYDNVVAPAFIDYQEALENYLIAQAILQTIEHRVGDVDPERIEVPGLAEAAARLEEVCGAFANQFAGEAAAQCAAYLKLRREIIDAGRGLCWQCGVEFAKGLLPRQEMESVLP